MQLLDLIPLADFHQSIERKLNDETCFLFSFDLMVFLTRRDYLDRVHEIVENPPLSVSITTISRDKRRSSSIAWPKSNSQIHKSASPSLSRLQNTWLHLGQICPIENLAQRWKEVDQFMQRLVHVANVASLRNRWCTASLWIKECRCENDLSRYLLFFSSYTWYPSWKLIRLHLRTDSI